jgi:AraC-like DNA-binding protein
MSKLTIRRITPHKLLQPYVYKMWVLEGKYGVVEDSLKRMSPNGTIKLILMYKGGLKGTNDTMTRTFTESNFTVIGQMTKPTVVEPKGEFGCIGIEFNPIGIYRLFNFSLSEITNSFYQGDEIFGSAGSRLQRQIDEITTVEGKIAVLESFLLKWLYESNRGDKTMDYALQQIVSHNGLVRIEDLCTDIGYSKRHLDRKFQSYAGISPKELACILRFQVFYKLGWKVNFNDLAQLYEYYYDQSHFIKEFKKFTGNSPMTYFRKNGHFAEVFYN